MKAMTFMLLLTLMANPLRAQCGFNCGFYGGDYDPDNPYANGLANENDLTVGGDPYGAATYQNFIIGDFCPTSRCGTYPRNLYGLFTDNLSGLDPKTGYWEIRTGVSEGNGGILIASGTGVMTHTRTGRFGFGQIEYRDEVDNINVTLHPGLYWFAVVPNDPNGVGRSFNNNTFGLNGAGRDIDNQQYLNSAYFGENFTNANHLGVFPRFSSGVRITACGDSGSCGLSGSSDLPEPSSLILLGSGLLGAAVAIRGQLS